MLAVHLEKANMFERMNPPKCDPSVSIPDYVRYNMFPLEISIHIPGEVK